MSYDEKMKKMKEIRDFRYMIIGEIANPHLNYGEVKSLIRQKAAKKYQIPFSKKEKVSEATIRLWLKKFKKQGLDGLMPKIRSDYRQCKALTREEQDTLLEYLAEKPELTAKEAVFKLREKGRIRSQISKSSLSRFLKAAGFERKSPDSTKKRLKFNFKHPLECVQVDCMHAFPVDDEKGRKRKAILIAFLDDATRRIVYARFAFTEASIVFEKGIRHILSCHGRIGKIYTDNGSSFVSSQTQRILNILGIALVHSKPGIPEGRGKIERFFRTVRDQFLRPLDKASVTGLTDLNTRFLTWVECEYHRNPHRGLSDTTPLDAWLSKTKYLIETDPGLNLAEIFRHEERRKVYKDCTFTLHNNLYEAPPVLIGKKITLFYDPETPFWGMQIYHEGMNYGTAVPVQSYANSKVKRGENTKQLECLDSKQEKTPVWMTAARAGGNK